jgi:hypothetical protein
MDKGDIYLEKIPLSETDIIILLGKKENKGGNLQGFKVVPGGGRLKKKTNG